MNNPVVTVTLRLDKDYELDIAAPELSLDFVLSLLDRAKRILEVHEKLAVANQIQANIRAVDGDRERTMQVMKRVKLQ